MASPPRDLAPPSVVESQLSSLVYDLSQQMQIAMDNMLKMINEIDAKSAGITGEMDKSRESALERKIALEEEKNQFQKAAFAVFDMLNSHGNS
ncbi:uncharacterized protein LOC127265413 [Andrographis paniculata]|uniref:uncharacterized protein LOC127265413 n=1 Tax=Andrographis paniculata TaxID=175694 RepID=UPI0021E93C28|nr:uncharacterized protein LOC127265413 [Andrographis paniculata]